jgi:hypothetical protein
MAAEKETGAAKDPGEAMAPKVEGYPELCCVLDGFCQYCSMRTKFWTPVLTTYCKGLLFERGIDPKTGHKLNCSMK